MPAGLNLNAKTCQMLLISCCFVLLASVCFTTMEAQSRGTNPHTDSVDQAVQAMCGEEVALLGESPTHSFGKTLDFKVQVVRRLVEECHYNALFVESGLYDYVHIERERRAGHKVTESMISAAIGGLWANAEVQALVPFLRDKVEAGGLTLGGMDDQLGAGTYASRAMSADLVQPLQGEDRSRCLGIFQRHLLWQYTDDAPYGPSDKEKLVGCLKQIQTQLSSTGEKTKFVQESFAMVDSLQRNLSRNFTEDDFKKKEQALKWFNDRDRSMYLNYKWLSARLPPHSKVIVWAATVHIAKDLSGIEGFEGRVPLGFYVNHDSMGHAFSLGSSAYSGEYGFPHQPLQHLAEAPPTSLEGQVFAQGNADAVYLSREQLGKYNSIAGRLLGTDFTNAHWDRVVDGLVIFRVERVPAWVSRQP